MDGYETALAAGLGEHGVTQRQIGEGGEQPAMANAARIGVLFLDAQADRQLVAAAPLIERPDQRVERREARHGAKRMRHLLACGAGLHFAFFTISSSARARNTTG